MGKGTTIGHFLIETDRACQRGDHLWFDLNTLEWLQIIHGRKKSFYFNRFWDYIDFIFSSPLFSGTKDSFRLFTSSKPIDMRKYYRSSVTKKVSARVIEAPWQKSSSCKRSSWLFQAVLLLFCCDSGPGACALFTKMVVKERRLHTYTLPKEKPWNQTWLPRLIHRFLCRQL